MQNQLSTELALSPEPPNKPETAAAGDVQLSMAPSASIAGLKNPGISAQSRGDNKLGKPGLVKKLKYGIWRSDTYGFALLSHNLGYASSLFLVVFGSLSMLWNYEMELAQLRDPQREEIYFLLWSYEIAGPYSIILGSIVFFFEFFLGLTSIQYKLFKEDRARSPFRALFYFLASICCFLSWPTMLAGGVMLLTSFANFLSWFRGEYLGRNGVKGAWYLLCKCKKKKKEEWEDDSPETFKEWIIRQYEIGYLQQLVFVALYLLVNLILWSIKLSYWIDLTDDERLKSPCPTRPYECISPYGPYAKAFGQLLNFNCALVLFPVLRVILKKINDFQVNYSTYGLKRSNSICNNFIAVFVKAASLLPPLRKHILFHKFVAIIISLATFGHILFHFINFAYSPEATKEKFGMAAWITGSIATFAMVIIFCGAQDRVKRAHYEVFWYSHHFVVVFYACLLAHAPNFWKWVLLPLVLYILEYLYRFKKARGNFYVLKVTYSHPVLCIHFIPENKRRFRFLEGQYLYLLCPHLSGHEWHPFTISSAEEEMKVLEPVDKGYISLHIRVQRKDSWTWNLREYFRTMVPSSQQTEDSFVLRLSRRDANGNLIPGKLIGPDGKKLIQIDGPFSAPAQNYSHHDDVMLVGAGIGLTPSAAIIQSILLHKWRKGHKPKTIHFFWVVRHSDVASFRWFIRLLTDMEQEVSSEYISGTLERGQNRLFIHIFVTSVPETRSAKMSQITSRPFDVKSIRIQEGVQTGFKRNVDIGFTALELEEKILNATCDATKFRQVMQSRVSNQEPHIFIWNGRPQWDGIFQTVKETKSESAKEIGVCFCGTPVIGKKLKTYCHKYSSFEQNCRFVLHKENF